MTTINTTAISTVDYGRSWQNFSDVLHQDFVNIFAQPSGYYSSCEEIGQGRVWWIFLLSSLACPFLLYMMLAVVSLIKWIRNWPASSPSRQRELTATEVDTAATFMEDYAGTYDLMYKSKKTKFLRIRWGHAIEREASRIVNCQTRPGRCLAVVAFLLAGVSFSIYILDVSDVVPALELCRPWNDTPEWKVDFACNMFFLLYFVLRFLASSRKFYFLSEVYSIVDYFTIAPSIVSMMLNRNWSGFRFLRVLHVFSIPEVFQYVGILKTRTQIRLTHLICRLVGVVLVGSGVFHLCENFYQVVKNGHSYWKFLYFTFVTISTVGYGDITPLSTLGRAFDCFFILGALGFFASSLPDIMNLFRSSYRYGGGFKPEAGIQHIVVCGHITYSIASCFLENFFHSTSETSYLCVVFISNEDPDVEMEALLRKNFSQVEYLQGDVLNRDDLRRAAVRSAMACMIIADKKPEATDVEDATNILRVISIKNWHPAARIIVQMYHKRNLVHLTNLSSWNSLRGDSVVAMNEFKMGLLAKSCIAPGFSTMVSNLMHFHPESSAAIATLASRRIKEFSSMDYYVQCTNRQMYLQKFSEYYLDEGFGQAARHCYNVLGVMLIGLFEKPTSWVSGIEFGEIMINPSAISITTNHMGIFIATTQEEVDRVWFYCKNCHKNINSPADVTVCACNEGKISSYPYQEQNPVKRFWMNCRRPDTAQQVGTTRTIWEGGANAVKLNEERESLSQEISIPINPHPMPVTPFGPPVAVSSMELEPRVTPPIIFAPSDLSRIRKHHWVPTRTFQESKLAADPKSKLALHRSFENHIVACVFAKPNASPLDLAEFVMPLRSGDIPFDELKDVILLGNAVYLEKEWSTICNFPKITVVRGNPMERADLEMVSINQCDTCVLMQSKSGHSKDEIMDDRETILATLNIKAMKAEDMRRRSYRSESYTFYSAPIDQKASNLRDQQKIISNIEHDENVQFLEREQSIQQRTVPLYMSDSYVSGGVFMESVLDALLVTSYFEPLACSLIRGMVHGRAQMGIMSEKTPSGTSFSYIPCPTVEQGLLKVISMSDAVFSRYVDGPYKNVVLEAFANGMVCIGVARSEYIQRGVDRFRSMIYPLTNPPPDLIMREDDDLYMFASYLASSGRHNDGIGVVHPSSTQGCRRTILVRRTDPVSKKFVDIVKQNMAHK